MARLGRVASMEARNALADHFANKQADESTPDPIREYAKWFKMMKEDNFAF